MSQEKSTGSVYIVTEKSAQAQLNRPGYSGDRFA